MEGSCHCGAIRFEAPAPETLAECNCSYCDRVGALWARCLPDQFRLLGDEAALAIYRFNTEMVTHHHCPTCGCATHGSSPDFSSGEPDMSKTVVHYNVRMMRDCDRSSLPVVRNDGASY